MTPTQQNDRSSSSSVGSSNIKQQHHKAGGGGSSSNCGGSSNSITNDGSKCGSFYDRVSFSLRHSCPECRSEQRHLATLGMRCASLAYNLEDTLMDFDHHGQPPYSKAEHVIQALEIVSQIRSSWRCLLRNAVVFQSGANAVLFSHVSQWVLGLLGLLDVFIDLQLVYPEIAPIKLRKDDDTHTT